MDAAPVQAAKKSSRRMKAAPPASRAASSGISRRDTAVSSRSARTKKEERGGRSPSSSGNNNLIIGGVAALILAGVLALLAMRPGRKPKEAAEPAKTEDFTDHTPSAEWARRAAEELKRGDRQGAMHDYTHAAEAAEREGSTDQAQRYQMQAYDIQKFTHLNIAH